jgi:quercetin dioxygenase-like cupin family protein
MGAPSRNPPLPVQPAPELIDPALAPLLSEPLAQAWARGGPAEPVAQALRDRLARRLAASRQAEAAMVTTRRRRAPRQALAEGVTVQTLYRAQPGATLRPGEPLRACLIELAPGTGFDLAQLAPAAAALQREWLVVDGTLQLAGIELSARDYHVEPGPALAGGACRSAGGALLFLRESPPVARAGEQPFTLRDADAGWPDFAPGIRRRVLWQHDGQAALLYHAQPGAQVPLHRHGHDEECLMLQGELFLDDLLLQPGDYQLAPAGSGHRITHTDTGVVIYAHGDLDLQFV